MDLLAKLVLKLLVAWIRAHPTSAFSRFMTKRRGPRTDVASMNRVERLTNALVFLFWGGFFLGLWALTGYLTFALGTIPQDSVVVEVLLVGLALLGGCGLLAGLYLLVRVLV